MRPAFRMFLALATATALVAACGGDDDDTAPSADAEAPDTGDDADEGGDASEGDDPCRLLDTESIEAFFGGTASVRVSDARGCTYDVETDDPIPPSVSVSLYPSSTLDDLEGVRASRTAPEDIDGVGDAAYYDPDLMLVQFLDGDLMVGVQSVGGSPSADAVRDFVITQATTVNERL